MIEALRQQLLEEPRSLYAFLRHLVAGQRESWLYTDLQRACAEFRTQLPSEYADCMGPLEDFIAHTQEVIFRDPWMVFAWRPRPGRWIYLRIHREQLALEELSTAAYLQAKEGIVGHGSEDEAVLTVDFRDFRPVSRRLRDESTIGDGLTHLNRRLAGRIFSDLAAGRSQILEFLSLHRLDGQNLMLSNGNTDFDSLRQTVQHLATLPRETPWAEIREDMRRRGFAPGWGDTAGRVRETMRLLMDLLDSPSPSALESFLDRIPMISRILIVSIHGWFAQDKVLGRPDTGGQVVYILDQARALEQEMRQRLRQQGVDVEPRILIATRLIPEADGTTCDQRLEPVVGSENVQILRVPFRYADGRIHPHWISRFKIWPWLERYALDLEREVLAELGSRPDLIIGNYSDGNLVATLLSERLGVTQCNIAHALEKSKYLYSDLHWRDHEQDHHFACQFTADLIAMNAADIIVTSTYQEIAGNDREIGQYEGHQDYTLPGLYRVENGIDVFDSKFNIVSPGADPRFYFSYTRSEERPSFLDGEIKALLYGHEPGSDRRGVLEDHSKPLLLSMARMDRIKNLSGLAELYGRSARLRDLANLVIIGGHVDVQNSRDAEEREEIRRMHEIMDHYQLDGQLRWVGALLDKTVAGELYRVVADSRGVFVQPALFEAFGLTVIEAMSSGLPVFATRFGGPLEIIEDGVSGFHIDPNDHEATAQRLADFLEAARERPKYWTEISDAALARVAERYTWERYAERLMTIARIFGFWRFVLDRDSQVMERYLQMFRHLQWRPLAHAVPLD